MIRHPVKSSHAKSVGYDPLTHRLEIEFHDGGTYEYLNVPPQIHDELVNANSIGKFIHNVIHPRFTGIKVNPQIH